MIVASGHPRGATAYTTKLLQLMGLDVRHEQWGDDGICAWFSHVPFEHFDKVDQTAGDRKWRPFSIIVPEAIHIHIYRDPVKSIASIVHENSDHLSFWFRNNVLNNHLEHSEHPIDRAIASYALWHADIKRAWPNAFVFRAEFDHARLYDFVSTKVHLPVPRWEYLNQALQVDTKINGRNTPDLDSQDWLTASQKLIARLDDIRETVYGEASGITPVPTR